MRKYKSNAIMPYATTAGWKGESHNGIVTIVQVVKVIAISANREEYNQRIKNKSVICSTQDDKHTIKNPTHALIIHDNPKYIATEPNTSENWHFMFLTFAVGSFTIRFSNIASLILLFIH
jgi:hypothetical protein